MLLSGACLPLQSISVPLLPLRAASRGSARSQLPQPWPLDRLEAIDNAPSLLDAWLQDVASSTPVVMLVDDLQWADESTLDVLMYLVAGPADRGFALLATARRYDLNCCRTSPSTLGSVKWERHCKKQKNHGS